jgi:hypothetical protein
LNFLGNLLNLIGAWFYQQMDLAIGTSLFVSQQAAFLGLAIVMLLSALLNWAGTISVHMEEVQSSVEELHSAFMQNMISHENMSLVRQSSQFTEPELDSLVLNSIQETAIQNSIENVKKTFASGLTSNSTMSISHDSPDVSDLNISINRDDNDIESVQLVHAQYNSWNHLVYVMQIHAGDIFNVIACILALASAWGNYQNVSNSYYIPVNESRCDVISSIAWLLSSMWFIYQLRNMYTTKIGQNKKRFLQVKNPVWWACILEFCASICYVIYCVYIWRTLIDYSTGLYANCASHPERNPVCVEYQNIINSTTYKIAISVQVQSDILWLFAGMIVVACSLQEWGDYLRDDLEVENSIASHFSKSESYNVEQEMSSNFKSKFSS